jgi:hypothetical protein
MNGSWIKARLGGVKSGDLLRVTVLPAPNVSHVVEGTVFRLHRDYAQVRVTAIASTPPDAKPPASVGDLPLFHVPECEVLVPDPEPVRQETPVADTERAQNLSMWRQRMAQELRSQINQARQEGRVLDVFAMEIELSNYR